MLTDAASTYSRFTQRTVAAVVATFAIAAAALLASASPAAAHDELIGTTLDAGTDGSVASFTLTYSNDIVKIGTEVHVTDAQGADVAKNDPDVSGRNVTQQLAAPLADGRYDAVWRVVSSDGHPIEGGFSFEVTDGASTEVLPLSDEFGQVAAPSNGDSEDEEAADEATAHSHDEGTEHSHDEANGTPAWVIPTVAIVAALAAAGAVAATILSKRRRG